MISRAIITILFIVLMVNLCAQSTLKLDSLQQALEQHSIEDSVKVNLLNNIGFEFWIVAPSQSELYGEMALELADRLSYQPGRAFAKRVIGVSHWARGNYDRALPLLIDAYQIYSELQDTLGTANSLMNIGLVYSDQRNFTEAFHNFFESIKMFEKLGEEGRIATTYNKIGSIYSEQGQFDQAQEYFEKALKIHNKEHFRYGIAESYNRLGLLFRDRGDYNQALDFTNQSLEISREIDDKEGTTKNLENLASIYIRQGQYARAEQYLREGKELAAEIGSKKWLKDIYFDLKEIALYRRDYPEAFRYYEAYTAMKDSLFNEEKAAQMADLRAQFEISEREKTIALKKQEISLLQQRARFNNLTRNILIAGLLFLVILTYLIISQLRLRIKNSRLRERELQKELDYRSRELTTYTLNFIQKNEIMEELKGNISEIQRISEPMVSKKLGSLYRLVDHSFNLDKDWQEFKIYFEQVHPEFFVILKEKYPDLSNSELRLCALIKLNLTMKESATILGISPDSVKTARYRLRKKLGLVNEVNLSDFIRDVDKREPMLTEN